MRIGIDVDGVIFETEKDFRVLSEICDVNNFNKSNVIDNRIIRFQDRYNWNFDFSEEFYRDNVFKLEEESSFVPGSIKVLNLLKDMGYELYIITARGRFSEKQIEITKRRLKENNLDIFKKYIFKSRNKKKDIIENNIDFMIDDNIDILQDVKDVCKSIYLKDSPSFEADDDKIKTVYNWGEVYRYFKNIKEVRDE